jgi:hypothetical protein
MIEGVAVAVVRGLPEDGDAIVVLKVAKLAVVRDVAPNEVPSLAAPGRALEPHASGVEAVDARVVHAQRPERRVDGDHIGVGIGNWICPRAEVARRVGNDVRRGGPRGGGCGGGGRRLLRQHLRRKYCHAGNRPD